MTTFGVELEFCSNLYMKKFVQKLQSKQINVIQSKPKKSTSTSWKVEKDDSVLCKGLNRFGASLKPIEKSSKTSTRMYPFEVVSPILKNTKSLIHFLKTLHSLNLTFSINQTHGFHIHLSNQYLQQPFESFGIQWVTAFCVNWIVFEKLILNNHHKNRLKSPHARTLMSNLKFTNRLNDFDNIDVNDKSLKFDYILQLFNPTRYNFGSKQIYPKGPNYEIDLSNGRNSVVNLTNLELNKKDRKGTIEIRSHEGTLNIDKILHFVKFMKTFFSSVYDTKNKTFLDMRLKIKNKFNKKYTQLNKKETIEAINLFLNKTMF